MSTRTFTLSYDDGTVTATPANVQLQQGQDATVQLDDSFPAGSSIDSVTIYSDQAKTNEVCAWVRDGTGKACKVYSFTAVSATEIHIVDEENPPAEVDYWFSAAGSPSWSVDPELSNEPTGSGSYPMG